MRIVSDRERANGPEASVPRERDDTMAEGFLLPWAAEDLLERARRSDIPAGELP